MLASRKKSAAEIARAREQPLSLPRATRSGTRQTDTQRQHSQPLGVGSRGETGRPRGSPMQTHIEKVVRLSPISCASPGALRKGRLLVELFEPMPRDTRALRTCDPVGAQRAHVRFLVAPNPIAMLPSSLQSFRELCMCFCVLVSHVRCPFRMFGRLWQVCSERA